MATLTEPGNKRLFGLSGSIRRSSASTWLLLAALSAITLPTLFSVARHSWTTEQGGHGPIVLATGLWLLWEKRAAAAALVQPAPPTVSWAAFSIALLVYVVSRITGIIELEGLAIYGILLSVVLGLCGTRVLKFLWFPLLYLGFIFPPPDQLVALLTQPLKIAISETAVSVLHWAGYPIGSSGVTIQIGQYQLLVAAACSGINSMISLTAIGLFYVYLRHNANWRYALLLTAMILPVAAAANFLRVILLILITYHWGEAAAQGFVHNFAGLVTFSIALLAIILIDAALTPLRRNLSLERPR